MWLIKIITFIEYHPYLVLSGFLALMLCIRFFFREQQRPSYRQQRELERFLHEFEEARPIVEGNQKKPPSMEANVQ